jgi:hypothetical protein
MRVPGLRGTADSLVITDIVIARTCLLRYSMVSALFLVDCNRDYTDITRILTKQYKRNSYFRMLAVIGQILPWTLKIIKNG